MGHEIAGSVSLFGVIHVVFVVQNKIHSKRQIRVNVWYALQECINKIKRVGMGLK